MPRRDNRYEGSLRQRFLEPRRRSLIESFALERLGLVFGFVRIDGEVGIPRRSHPNAADLRAEVEDFLVGERCGTGERIDVDALDVCRSRAVAVRGGNGELKRDVAAA